MNPEERNAIDAALKAYGSGLTEDRFIINARIGEPTKLYVHATKDRYQVRLEGRKGQLYFSGPRKPETVTSFVEQFWHWKKSE